MFSDDEIRDARECVANPNADTRSKMNSLRILRAHAAHRMSAIVQRSHGGAPTGNDSEAFDRIEREHDEHEAALLRMERDYERDLGNNGTARDLFAASAAPTGANRTASAYLNTERRMADVVREQRGYGREDIAEAQGFNVGAMLRGMLTGSGLAGDSPERRAILGNTDAQGGVMLPELVGAELIDALIPATVVHEAGALAYPMRAGKETLPGIDTLPTPEWRSWGSDVAESDPSFRGVQLDAKTLAVRFNVPVEMIEDISPQANLGIEQILVAALALEVNRAALLGDPDADPQSPQGLYGTPGVHETALDAAPADWSTLLGAYFAVRKRNARPSAFILSERDAESHAGFTASDGQPLRLPPAIENVPQLSTTSVPTNLGTGTDEGLIFAGEFSRMVVGYRPQIGVRVLRSLDPKTLSNTVVAYIRADVGVLWPEAFEVVTGVQPPA